VLPWLGEDPKQGEIYAVGLARFGEEEYDPDWLAPDELRLARVADRETLLARYPRAGAQIVWNVADFHGPELAFVPHMMDPALSDAEEALSKNLTRELGDKAVDLYDRHFERALREVDWSRWFALTDDFVIFTWDRSYGSRLRESLSRNASPEALELWSTRGWLP
jgi:hypothetical protein